MSFSSRNSPLVYPPFTLADKTRLLRLVARCLAREAYPCYLNEYLSPPLPPPPPVAASIASHLHALRNRSLPRSERHARGGNAAFCSPRNRTLYAPRDPSNEIYIELILSRAPFEFTLLIRTTSFSRRTVCFFFFFFLFRCSKRRRRSIGAERNEVTELTWARRESNEGGKSRGRDSYPREESSRQPSQGRNLCPGYSRGPIVANCAVRRPILGKVTFIVPCGGDR